MQGKCIQLLENLIEIENNIFQTELQCCELGLDGYHNILPVGICWSNFDDDNNNR